MNTTFSSLAIRAGLVSGAVLLLSGVPARAQNPKQTDAFPTYDSYIKITGQAPDVTGDKAAFQTRVKQPSNGGAGIEDLHLSNDLSRNTNLVVDGKALVGSEDYLAHLNLTDSKVGSVDAGYKRFRTFYDGVGGFFPLNKQWAPLATEDLHVDRSKLWVEASLALPDAPVFTVRYTNEERTGQKDSTDWGSSDFTGLPFTLAPNPITQTRKFTPAIINLDERHEHLELTAKHTIKNTELQLTLFGDRTNNADTRYATNFPGEVIPWSILSLSTTVPPGQLVSPQNAAKALLSAANWNNQVNFATLEKIKTQTSGVNAEAETAFNEQFKLHIGGNYELLHATDGGDRTIVTTTPTATGAVPVTTNNNQNLAGGSHVKEITGNVILDFKPTKTLVMKAGLRLGSEWVEGTTTYIVVAASGTPATTLASTPRIGYAKLQQNSNTPVFEARYTGIKDLTLYFTGDLRSLSGRERDSSTYNQLTATAGTLAFNDVKEDHKNFTLGALWTMSPRLSFRAEAFRKDHSDTSAGYATWGNPGVQPNGDYYLLSSISKGYKVTAIVKPTPVVTFTTRVVAQRNKMTVTGYLPTYPEYDSLKGRNYMVSESIDWTPTAQVYFQFTGTVNYNVISTIYPRAGATIATATANSWDVNKDLQNSVNDYSTVGFLSGFVVDKETDAQLQLNYYRANDSNAALATTTMPYGVATKELSITVGLKHKFSDKWVGQGKIGYFNSVNDTTGGMTNYHGPMAYLSLEHAL
jgi:hypothetical protein